MDVQLKLQPRAPATVSIPMKNSHKLLTPMTASIGFLAHASYAMNRRTSFRLPQFKGYNLVAAISIVTLTASLTPNAVLAGSYKLTAQGGDSGTPFELDCKDDSVLVGVAGKKDGSIASIRALCAKPMATGHWDSLTLSESASKGGDEGVEYRSVCPQNQAIAALNSKRAFQLSGWFVNELTMACKPLPATVKSNVATSNSGTTVLSTTTGAVNFLSGSGAAETCPANKPARGLHGKSGKLIDSIGLICHSGSTPAVLKHSAPSAIEIVVVTPAGNPSPTPTALLSIQFKDNSDVETLYEVELEDGRVISIPARNGSGSTISKTWKNCASGNSEKEETIKVKSVTAVAKRDGLDVDGFRATTVVNKPLGVRTAACSPIQAQKNAISCATGFRNVEGECRKN